MTALEEFICHFAVFSQAEAEDMGNVFIRHGVIHLFMEQRYANADRLERRTASVAATAGRCDADAVVITPNDADGTG